MKKIRIGQVGLGEWGLVIAKAIGKIDDFQIVACFDMDQRVSASYRKRFNAIEADSYDSLIARQDIEAIVITSPNQYHFAQAYEAALNNKHVFLEKPITTKLSDAKVLVEVFKKMNLIIAVGHNVRFYGIIRKAKALIENGEIGDIVLVEANRSMPRGLTLSKKEWRWNKNNMPGGVLSQLGIHMIDTLHYLFGPISKISSFTSYRNLPVEFADTVIMNLEFQNGILGYIGSSYSISDSFHIKIHGKKASLNIDIESGLYIKKCGQKLWKKLSFSKIDPEVEELKDFANSIRTGIPPQSSADQALYALKITLSSLKSANDDKVVRFKRF